MRFHFISSFGFGNHRSEDLFESLSKENSSFEKVFRLVWVGWLVRRSLEEEVKVFKISIDLREVVHCLRVEVRLSKRVLLPDSAVRSNVFKSLITHVGNWVSALDHGEDSLKHSNNLKLFEGFLESFGLSSPGRIYCFSADFNVGNIVNSSLIHESHSEVHETINGQDFFSLGSPVME